MDFVSLFSTAFCSGAGAFAGGLVAYFFAVRKDNQKRTADYLNLLLLIYSELDSLHSVFATIPADHLKVIDDEKVVVFDLPFPSFNLDSQQLLTLLDVAPDKQMSFGLIGMKHFLQVHSQRVDSNGFNILPLALVNQMEKQLAGMLLSVRVQFEQESNSEFPFYELPPSTSSQTKQ